MTLVYGGAEINSSGEFYTAFVQVENSNFVLNSTAVCQYRIISAPIEVVWSDESVFQYNATSQIRPFTLILPDFADADDYYAEILSGTEVCDPVGLGQYTIKIKSRNPGNFKILNAKSSFEIVKYQLRVVWDQNVTLVYNGEPQMPAFTADLPDFCNSLIIERVDPQISVGKYTAHLFAQSNVIEIENPAKPFEIVPCEVDVEWSNLVLTYNGDEQKPAVVCAENGFETVEVAVVSGYKNQGTYTATAEIISENAANFVLKNPTEDYLILPYIFTAVWDTSEIVYDAKPHAPKILNGLPSFAQTECIKYSDTAIDVGENYSTTISVTNDDSQNIMIANPTCEFSIVPAKVNVSWQGAEFVYNGEVQFPQYELVQTFATDYATNAVHKNVGEYTAEIVSKSKNYCFENSTYEYVITPCEIVLEWTDINLEYNGCSQKPVVRCDETTIFDELKFTVSGDVVDAGDYIAVASIENDEFGNYKIKNSDCAFTIFAKELVLTWQNTELIYNGVAQSPLFLGGVADVMAEITCDSYVDRGEYIVRARIEDSNYTLKNSETQFIILPKPITVEWENFEFGYDGEFHCPVASTAETDLKISGAQINCGEHVATCQTLSKNYEINNPTHTFVINKYEISIVWSDKNYVYNGSSQCPTPSFEIPEFLDESIFVVTGAQVDAGTEYVATITCRNTNIYLNNSQKKFEIEPYPLDVVWENCGFVFNGTEQMPQYYLSDNAIAKNLIIETSGAGVYAGQHTVSLTLNNTNFELCNSSKTYYIEPYVLTVTWSRNSFVFNNQPQAPICEIDLPDFADDLRIVQPAGSINAGQYCAVAKILPTCGDAYNFVLDNDRYNFEILPYTLDLGWSDTDCYYSGEPHVPTVTILNNLEFAYAPQITVYGAQILVGTYTATAVVEDENFVLANASCDFVIYPQAVVCECEEAKIQVSAPNEHVLDTIDVINIEKDKFDVPHGQVFLFGFEILAIVQVPMGYAIAFDTATYSGATASSTYFVKLYLSENFEMPADASLYLYNDGGYTKLDYEMESNVITFIAEDLGKIYLAVPAQNHAFLPLAIFLGILSLGLIILLIYEIYKFFKSKKISKN